MTKAVIRGTFEVSWQTDEFRKDFNDDISDEDILDECLAAVRDNPAQFVQDDLSIEAYLA